VTPRVAAVAAIVAVLAGCGSGSAKKHEDAAAARWRTGLAQWDRTMTRAIDDLSVILGGTSTLRAIQHGDARLIARLTTNEETLFGCRKRVEGLGRVPSALAQAHTDALLACKNLELGATLVRDGVRRLQIGLGSEVLTQSSEPLGSGQDVLMRVRVELKQAG